MLKILAIDDIDENLVALRILLEKILPGHLFYTAAPDRESIIQVGAKSPDVIFIDLSASVDRGLEACALLKKDLVLKGTPVIILTDPTADSSHATRALQSGADAFLFKPLNDIQLTALLTLLKRLKQPDLPARQENEMVEKIVSERTRRLKGQLDDMLNTEKELKKSYAELETAKLATLNLMEDLRAEVDHRKRSEETLLESQQKFRELSILFRSISDNMTDMLWAKDMDRNYIFTNKSFCDHVLIANDTAEPIGKNDLFFAMRQRQLHPENPDWHTFGEICMDSDQVVINSGKPEQFDESGNIQGNFLFLNVRKSPLFDLNGKMIGTVGSAQDHTSEREISKQLAQRERQLSTLVGNLPGMVYRCLEGYDGEMLFVSDGCLAVTGYSREDYLDKKSVLFNSLILDEYRDSVLDKWHVVLKRGQTFEGEYPIKTATGAIKWVWERCRGEYGENGELIYVEGYIEDITERKRAVEALKESEQRYETFINSINDFAFLKDENFKYLFINNSNAEFFGRRPEEIIGMDDFELMQHDYAMGCRANDIKAVKGTGVVISEELVEGRIYESRKFPVRLKNGRIGLGGYIRDITDQKTADEVIKKLNDELENRVLERTAQLETANKELEAFSYSVSHDLRAPLRAIDGFTRILFEDYEHLFDAEGKRLCAVIQENAIRMGQLIDDLLALSRLNRADIHVSRFDMETFAKSVFAEITTEEERLRTTFNLSGVHPALGDQVVLKQVLVNLLGNAVKFSSKRSRAEITMSSEIGKGMVVYCIRDNGAGFDMKYSDKLFGAFQRLHSIREFEGNGIGLAIVQRIIHRHGGKVWAEGAVDKGASFYFSLPLKAQNTK